MTLPRKMSVALAGEDSSITINGTELHGIAAATIHYEPHVTPVLTLTLLVHQVTADGYVNIEIPGRVRDALTAIGWTPPADHDEVR